MDYHSEKATIPMLSEFAQRREPGRGIDSKEFTEASSSERSFVASRNHEASDEEELI